MDALSAAIPLARLFLALAHGRRHAVVSLSVRGRRVSVHVEAGHLVAISGVDLDSLGDTLLRQGGLDKARHRAAFLQEMPPEGRVGAWLVSVGAASRGDVERALELQLYARLGHLLRHRDADVEVGLQEAPADGSGASASGLVSETQADLPRAVFDGLCAVARSLPADVLSVCAGQGPLKLTHTGSRLLAALSVTAGEGEPIAASLSAAFPSTQLAVRAVLCALGAAVATKFDGDAFRLLLRKQREIRRCVGPRALLDLPPHAHAEQARPALRKLATKLHPDKFHGLDPALFAASHDVMRALSHAEGELRAPHSVSR